MYEYDVSVVIPAYNAEKTIERAIRSAMQNHTTSIQVVVVNDGSTDKTLEKAEFLQCKDILVVNKKNGGVSSARNEGIVNALGKYIFFLDSDDYLVSGILDKMVEFADTHKLDFVSCEHGNAAIKDNKEKVDSMESFVALTPNEIGKRFLELYPKTVWAKLFKAKLIKENNLIFSTEMSMGEDKHFTLNALMKAERVGKVCSLGYLIDNVNPYSLSKKYCKNFEESLLIQYDQWTRFKEIYPLADQSYHHKNVDYNIHIISEYIANLYRLTSPFTSGEKICLIRGFIKKNEFLFNESNKVNTPKNLVQFIQYHLVKSKNVYLLAAYFSVKEYFKHIIVKIKSS